MKICYIIAPFEDPEYLIRCVNSLYRQLGGGYEVILAENDFGEDSDGLEGFFNEKRRLIRISRNAGSREEKLAEAVRLLPADSSYVMLVDVNTVISPVAAQAILGCGKADMILPAVAVREGNGFLLDNSDEIKFIEKIERHTPDRICFSRELFAELSLCFTSGERKAFCCWLLEKLSENPAISCTKDVCMYMEGNSEEKTGKLEIPQLKAAMAKTADNFDNIGSIKLKIGFVSKFTADFLEIMEGDMENAAFIFAELQNLCGKCKASPLLNKLVEQRVGFPAEELHRLSLEEYGLFQGLAHGKDGLFLLAGHPVTQDRRLSETEKTLEKLGREVASVKEQAQRMPTEGSSFGQIFTDPVRDVPRLYREGRLGLRTILYSLKGWLGYKLCGGNR